jgi:hypothetical protein
MLTRELIEELQSLPPDLPVVFRYLNQRFVAYSGDCCVGAIEFTPPVRGMPNAKANLIDLTNAKGHSQ